MIGDCVRLVLVSCLTFTIICVIIGSATSAPLQDYERYGDVYDWLGDHDVERREHPSMRLRFGKRGDSRGSMWTVEQRSMPSLRLRFGKRDGENALEEWSDTEETKRGGSRSPALRLRFGKREIEPQQQELSSAGTSLTA